ncbi:nuclear transport factor 2 family protein [Nonomuraea longicatena]|uniref:SnoaL-like domain-containing protein n=1 Tax=Nonomuraea longicatena TaxID=83682 RepID=A0ABN1PFE8_9ACTN
MRALLILGACLAVGACSGGTAPERALTEIRLTAPTASAGAEDVEAAAAVVDRFIAAANSGDVPALREVFATDARFDRAGAVFTGRDEIIDRFLKPDVTDAGGRYNETGRLVEGDRLTVAFTFDTGGGTERFTYSVLVRGEQIVDVIGRYLPSVSEGGS